MDIIAPPKRLRVVRPYALVFVAVGAVSIGCSSVKSVIDPLDACMIDPAAGWQRVQPEIAGADTLLGLRTSGTSVNERLGRLNRTRQEAWFQKDSATLMVCRYDPVKDPCERDTRRMEIRSSEGAWLVGEMQSVVCTGSADH